MRRILLVLENFQELSTLQGLLMKFGWEVDGVKRDVLVREKMITFAPEVIVADAKGSNVNGARLVNEMKTKSPGLHFFLIVKSSSELASVDSSLIEGLFKKPIDPKTVICALAKYSPARQKTILEKYEKMFGEPMPVETIQPKTKQEPEAQPVVVRSQPQPSRTEKYAKIVASVPDPSENTWDASQLSKVLPKVREEETSSQNDEDRQEFVKRLFGK